MGENMSGADSLKVPFSRPSISEEEKKAVLEVLNSGWLYQRCVCRIKHWCVGEKFACNQPE